MAPAAATIAAKPAAAAGKVSIDADTLRRLTAAARILQRFD